MKLLKSSLFIVSLLCCSALNAQTAFWSFDVNNDEIDIPLQCDGQFDETRGGVFLPTPDELYDYGESFLLEKGKEKNKAAYCFLSAALQGHVDAQYRIAQMYNKGIVLPQNDLASYKWAFLASLHGHKKAERMALTLEQILSTTDIDLATQSIRTLLPALTSIKNSDLAMVNQDLENKKKELEEINKEIDDILGISFKAPAIKKPIPKLDDENGNNVHFSEKDRM